MLNKLRAQRVYVIQRLSDNLYCANIRNPVWTDDITQADFVSATRFKGIVRADWGRDLEDYKLCEVVPQLLDQEAE